MSFDAIFPFIVDYHPDSPVVRLPLGACSFHTLLILCEIHVFLIYAYYCCLRKIQDSSDIGDRVPHLSGSKNHSAIR